MQTPLLISTPPNSEQTCCGCLDRRARCHTPQQDRALCSLWPVPPPHGPATHCNVVWWCWHRPGCSELPLPARENLPFRLWQDSVLSRNTLTPDEVRGTKAATCRGEFDSSYLSKSQDIGISDKGKICLERDSATRCLILVFWYFRYRNSFHLFTALHSHRFVTSQHQSPFSKMTTLS